MGISHTYLASAYQNACLAEVEAIKPGNVHIYADGHGMVVKDFVDSATASAKPMTNPEFSLGERIYKSVEATWHTVGCNTNLGIVLLCAPVIQACIAHQEGDFVDTVSHVLANTTVNDAQWAFDAIQLASPAGLGDAGTHDVNQKAECTLLESMRVASDKDMIAQQYASNFNLVLEQALPLYQQLLTRWARPAWAVTGVYLYWLANYQDSHLKRKFGTDVSLAVKAEAIKHLNAFQILENPKVYLPQLLKFDSALKAKGWNPGTSADLTVVTILIGEVFTTINNN